MIVEIQRQNAKQHQHRTRQRVEEELDGSIKLPRSAPHANDEIHRHQHHFPEDVEEEEVERHEHAEHAYLQQHEHRVVFLRPVFDRCPRREHGQESEHRGQHDEQETDSVDS